MLQHPESPQEPVVISVAGCVCAVILPAERSTLAIDAALQQALSVYS